LKPIQAEEFKKMDDKEGLIVLFYIQRTSPCRKFIKRLETMDLEVRKMNLDSNALFCQDLEIKAVPTLIKFDEEGEPEVWKTGSLSKDEVKKYFIEGKE